MAESGYYVGDKATGVSLKTHLETEGIAGGSSVTQQAANSVAQNDIISVTHAADTTDTRIVQVTEFVAGEGASNTSLDFDTIDEGNYIQEDNVNGTEFVNGVIRLKPSGTVFGRDEFDETSITPSYTLSNNNLTVTTVAGAVGHASTTDFKTSGKFYFEYTKLDNGYAVVGIKNSDIPNTTEFVETSNNDNYLIAWVDGQIIGAGNDGTVYPGFTNYAGTVGIAVDIDNSQVTYVQNNTEYGPYNATTMPTWGGVTVIVDQWYSVGGSVTIRTADVDFINTVPTGYDGRLQSSVDSFTVSNKYVTTGTNQIDTSAINNITSASITAVTPNDTSVSGLVSFDGRTTWEYWDGSAWNNLGALDLSTYNWLVNTNNILIQSDTTNLDTVIVNEYGTNPTEVGDVYHSTDAAKFGATSLLVDSSSYLTISDIQDWSNGFTMDCWFRLDSTSGAKTILSADSDFGFGIGHGHAANKLTYHISSTGGSWNISNGSSGIKTDWLTDTWYHLAFTWDGSAYRLFIDGVLDIEVTSSAAMRNTGFRVGRWGQGSYPFSGYIDEIAVALGTPTWTSNFTPPTSAATPIVANANSLTQIETGLTGLTITDETFLDFAFDLSTTVTTDTPEIDQITINYIEAGSYQYAIVGLSGDYSAINISPTQTNVKKLSAGTENIKINVLT